MFGVHGLHAGDVDQENRKPTIEGLKEEIRGENRVRRCLCRSASMAFTPAI